MRRNEYAGRDSNVAPGVNPPYGFGFVLFVDGGWRITVVAVFVAVAGECCGAVARMMAGGIVAAAAARLIGVFSVDSVGACRWLLGLGLRGRSSFPGGGVGILDERVVAMGASGFPMDVGARTPNEEGVLQVRVVFVSIDEDGLEGFFGWLGWFWS